MNLWKSKPFLVFLGISLFALIYGGCGVYSFTGSSIEPGAKTVDVHYIENRAAIINPTLSQKLTQELRDKVTSQTRLAQVNSDNADYTIRGNITSYNISNAAVSNVENVAASRLTITVNITFKDNLDPKKNFEQSFSRSADYSASQDFNSVENQLVETINNQLTDDIFNKAFVNW